MSCICHVYVCIYVCVYFQLPWSEALRRRLERLNANQRRCFLADREETRSRLVFEETERQRLRALVAHCQLVRMYLLSDQVPQAHDNLRQCFHECANIVEHR